MNVTQTCMVTELSAGRREGHVCVSLRHKQRRK